MIYSGLTEVVVLGAGRIGSANDAVPNTRPLSHVGAILAVDGLQLRAVVEPDDAARRAARDQWVDRTDAVFAESIEALAGESPPDVVALCSPTVSRERDAIDALKLRPRVLVIEKPLTLSTESARRILHAAEHSGVKIIVNYNRRFDPATEHFHSLFPGPPMSVLARYGKGLANYASHMVDLLGAWFGPVVDVQAISECQVLESDLSVSFRMQFKSGLNAFVLSIDGVSYDQFEIDFLFPDRQMSYLAGGAQRELRFAKQDLYYRGYRHLTAVPDATWQGQIGGFVELYRAILAHTKEGHALRGCSGADALRVLQVLEAIGESSREGGKIVRV